ncbi:MAG: sugar ABC transporter permease [Anaerolineae bacterium]
MRLVRRETFIGWLFVLPALIIYAAFVLLPLGLTIYYSFFRWNGVGPMTWVGLKNYTTVFEFPNLLGTILNAFWLVVWFSFIPVGLGLVVASVMHRIATGRFGAIARTVLFLPQVIPLVAAGIIWGWLLSLSGLVNQILNAIGLTAVTRAWLGDFDWALPAVGIIGIWVLLGSLHRTVVDRHVKDRSSNL